MGGSSAGICSIDGCDRKTKCKGLCAMHYGRFQRHGSTELPDKPNLSCKVDGCTGKHFAKNLCNKHYTRLLRKGSTDEYINPGDRVCTYEGCSKPHKSKGLCTTHYSRLLKQGTTELTRKPKTNNGPCTVDGCEITSSTRGLCTKHYSRLIRHGTTDLLKEPEDNDPLNHADVNTYSMCSAYGCKNVATVKGRCKEHYEYYRLTGSDEKPDTCTVDACPKYEYQDGLCQQHYKNKSKYGDPNVSCNKELLARVDQAVSNTRTLGKDGAVNQSDLAFIARAKTNYQLLADDYGVTTSQIHKIKTGRYKKTTVAGKQFHEDMELSELDPDLIKMISFTQGDIQTIANTFRVSVELVRQIKLCKV